MENKKYIKIAAAALLAVTIVGVSLFYLRKCADSNSEELAKTEEVLHNHLFGIDIDTFTSDTSVVESGETLSTILAQYGIGAAVTDRISRASDSVFSVRNIRADHKYYALRNASDSTDRLVHLIYQQSITDYVIFSIFNDDSVSVRKEQKDVVAVREKRHGKITSSLWNAMADGEMHQSMAMDLSDIFAWSIDFFGLQKGDHFTVIYDNLYVDSTNIGAGRIWGAIFSHGGKEYYAIPFMKNGKVQYWDLDGNSLRKNLLKAPLKFSRISSRFSHSRLHPIYKIRRPHHGVDYAAPSGTPVHAVADGVVTQRGYSGGAGNMLKIKHAGNLMSGYLHLRGFAKGISVGKRVSQGDLIGYVGSTGSSTGPHLDFRLWRGSKAIDPLKVPSEPAEPIAAESKTDFMFIKDRIVSELKGDIADSMKITQLETRPYTSNTTSLISQNVNR